MVPTKTSLQVLCYLSTTIIHFGILCLLINLAKTEDYKNVTEFSMDFFKNGGGFNSKYDFNVFESLITIFHIFHGIIIYQLFAARIKMCEVFNEVQEYSKQNCLLAKSQLINDFRKYFYKLAFINFGWPIFIIGFTINIVEQFSTSIFIWLPFIFSYIFWIFWCLAPMYSFHLYFHQITFTLHLWIQSAKENQDFEDYPKMVFCLNMWTSTISKLIFWIFLFLILCSIIESYLLVAFFLSQDGFSLATILLMIGYGFIGSLFLFLIHTYCKTSQIVTDSIIELKHRIIQSHLEEEDNQSNRTKMTKRIVFELEQFHGFHGNGYFVLGKPLVTSIVATFATYLIILIEFKVSQ